MDDLIVLPLIQVYSPVMPHRLYCNRKCQRNAKESERHTDAAGLLQRLAAMGKTATADQWDELIGFIATFLFFRSGAAFLKSKLLSCEKHWQQTRSAVTVRCVAFHYYNFHYSPQLGTFFFFKQINCGFPPPLNRPPTMISAEDISEYNYRREWGSAKAQHRDYDSLISISQPEVKYWFSAKEHHGQERCATLVKEPCTPGGMMGERRGRANGQKKKEKGNNRSPVRLRGGERSRSGRIEAGLLI